MHGSTACYLGFAHSLRGERAANNGMGGDVLPDGHLPPCVQRCPMGAAAGAACVARQM